MQTKALPCVLAAAAIVSSTMASSLHAQPFLPSGILSDLGHDASTASWHRPGPSPAPPEGYPGSQGAQPQPVAVPHRRDPSRPPTSLEELLRRTDLVDIVGCVEANWGLVQADTARAYDLVEAAALRYQRLAVSPSRPSDELLEIRVMHGQAAVSLYRLLQRIDPERSATTEGRARLESLRATHQSHAAAAAVAMALRQLAFTDWAESPWDDDEGDVTWTSAGIRRMGPMKSAADGGWPVAARWAFGAMVAVGLAGFGMGRGRLGQCRTSRPRDGGWVAHDPDPDPPF